MNDRLEKLLTLALHPKTPTHEAESAGMFFIRGCRKAGLTPDQLMRGAPGKNKDDDGDIRMPFGKYKGMTLRAMFSTDMNYCAWAVENMDILRPAAREYLRTRLRAEANA